MNRWWGAKLLTVVLMKNKLTLRDIDKTLTLEDFYYVSLG